MEQRKGGGFQIGFERFSHRVTEATGRPGAFMMALLTIVIWVATGPIFVSLTPGSWSSTPGPPRDLRDGVSGMQDFDALGDAKGVADRLVKVDQVKE